MQFTRVNGVNLAYYVSGSGGVPVLMIQGLGGRAADWGSVPARLAPCFEAITFDNRGTGKSDKPDTEYHLDVMAEEAVAVLQAAGHQEAHVVGLSMGGMIAQLVAVRYPQRVRKLVLLSTTPGGSHSVSPTPAAMAALIPDMTQPPEQIVRSAMRAIAAPGFIDAHPEVLKEIVQTAMSAPTPQFVLARQMAAIMASDCYPDLVSIHAPTLVIHGDADPLVPYANGQKLAARIPGAQLMMLQGCGHLAMWEQPEELARLLLSFLS
jgi:pimeloyl-ACP methyl ester carboxylesterase